MIRVLAAFMAAATALLIAFAAQSVRDTQSIATARSALVITHVSEDAPVIPFLRSEASRLGANFYQVRIDPTGETPTRTLGAIIGDRGSHDEAFPSGTYAAFDTSMTTKLVQIRTPELGAYLTTMPPRALEDVVKRLSITGADAHVETLSWGRIALYLLAYTPIVMAGAVAVGAAWLSGFVRTLSRTREHAVSRAHGALGPFARDLGTSVLISAAALGVAAIAAALMLRAYNGGQQLPTYFSLGAVILGVFVMAFIGGSWAPGVLPRQLKFRPAFSTWRPRARGAFAMAVVQVATLTFAVLLTAQAATAWSSIAVLRASGPNWRTCSACTVAIFNGFGGQTALNDAVAPFGAAVRALEPGGGVVLSWVPGTDRGGRFSPGDAQSNVIVANLAFIERSHGRLPNPLRESEGPGEWGLLVPSDRTDEVHSIAAEWRNALREPLGDVPNRAEPKQPHVAMYSPGSVFNYGRTDFRDKVFSESPLIVVVPASAGLLDDDSYFAAGSSGNLLFTEPAEPTRHALDASGVEQSVYSLDQFETQIARGISTAQSKLSMALIGAAAGLAALIGMLGVRTQAGISARRDQLILLRTQGCSPVRVHLTMLPRTLVLLVGTGSVVLISTSSGLIGADIAPGTLEVVALATALAVIATDAIVTARLSSMKALISNVR